MAKALTIGAVVLAALGLAAFVAVRGAAFWSGGSPAPAVPSVGRGGAPDHAAAKRPAFNDWPEPAAVLVLTGNQHGYLEPCGCSESQSGGVARRADLVKQLEAKGWKAAGLDLGGMVEKTRKQTQIKFAAIVESLDQLGYRGVGLGPEELRLGPEFLLTQNVAPPDGSDGPVMLAANVAFFETPDLPGGPTRLLTFELGGARIGVTAVLGEKEQRSVFPEGAASNVTFRPAADVLPEVVKELEAAGTTLNVLLAYADLEESKALAQKFPQFRVVVSAGGPEDPDGKPIKVGESLVLTVGQKGKNAGVLGLYPADKRQPLRFDLVNLARENFAHDTRMDAVMAEYQQTLKDNLSEVFADLPEGFPPKPGTYVGAAKCGECHTKAYKIWKETRHAHAYVSLAEGRKGFDGTWTPRRHDPECLACHVVGWNPQEEYPYVSGFLPKEIAAERGEPTRFELLQGQQCENCHGPGSGHVEAFARWKSDPKSVPQAELAAGTAAVKVSLATAEQTTCVKCHDYENSPHFEFKPYWDKVKHPYRD